ncbi:MAG: prepilin-type N-terminal cleavage/methylation domain-containing protein [Desulfobacteraceae bacterium]|nr:prepilin-type N-terminal cleavage/methylation domain-containing protein [Desulfobacteraceae bacterium]
MHLIGTEPFSGFTNNKNGGFANNKNGGFTLIEMLIAMAVSSIILVGVFASFSTQSKTHTTQREISKIQQDIRGALYMIEFDLMNAGRDPNMANRYGLTDIRHYDLTVLDNISSQGAFNLNTNTPFKFFDSFQILEFSSLQFDDDGDLTGDQNMVVRYQIYDFNNDNRPDLGRRVSAPGGATVISPPDPILIAENVVAVGYAFAYDDSPDGTYKLARTAPLASGDPLGNIIWAVDTDGDNLLDTNIDINGDGDITIDDDISGDGIIDNGDSIDAALADPVELSFVRAVRIMILVQSEIPSPERMLDTNRYVVGNQIIPPTGNPFNDFYKRRYQTVIIALRNFRKI